MSPKMLSRLIISLCAIILCACAAPERVSISGSTTVLPAVSRAAEQFTMDTGQLITVNAGGDVDIFVIDKEASSGTRQTFMEIVMGNSKAEAPAANLVIGSNNEEQTALTQSNAAIGMLSIAWLNDDVKGLSIKSPAGLIAPTLENISNGSFPIVRDLNIIIRGDISPKAQAFVDYLLSPAGQVFVERSGYIKAAP